MSSGSSRSSTRETRDLSNEAAAVIAEIGENPHVHKELLRNTVEVVTGICD